MSFAVYNLPASTVPSFWLGGSKYIVSPQLPSPLSLKPSLEIPQGSSPIAAKLVLAFQNWKTNFFAEMKSRVQPELAQQYIQALGFSGNSLEAITKTINENYRRFTQGQFDQAFEACGDKQVNLLACLAMNLGTLEFAPARISLDLEKRLEAYLRERLERELKIQDLPLKLMDIDTEGVSFLVRDGKNPDYILKLSHHQDSKINQAKLPIQDLEQGIKRNHKLAQEFAPDFAANLQSLAGDSEKKYLGIPNHGLATWVPDGVKLNFSVQADQLSEYVSRGLSDEFLKKFVRSFVKLAEHQADFGVLTHYNSIYQADKQELFFVDLISPRDNRYQTIKRLYQEKPLMFAVYKLITDIQMFQSTRVASVRTAIEEASGESERFWQGRYEQLERCLKDLQNEGLDIKQALIDLERAYQDSEMQCKIAKDLYLTDLGKQYIQRLITAMGGE